MFFFLWQFGPATIKLWKVRPVSDMIWNTEKSFRKFFSILITKSLKLLNVYDKYMIIYVLSDYRYFLDVISELSRWVWLTTLRETGELHFYWFLPMTWMQHDHQSLKSHSCLLQLMSAAMSDCISLKTWRKRKSSALFVSIIHTTQYFTTNFLNFWERRKTFWTFISRTFLLSIFVLVLFFCDWTARGLAFLTLHSRLLCLGHHFTSFASH